MVRVIARQPHLYDKVQRQTGDIYEAQERDVVFLKAFGNSVPFEGEAMESAPAPVIPEAKGRYKRRDMRAKP